VTIPNPDSVSSHETGYSWDKKLHKKKKKKKNNTYLNELDVRIPLVESISQRSEELRL
jgi:hypothetical protein